VTYDWRTDSFESWLLALHWMAVTRGLVRPATCEELYWAEASGAIP
jgi:hypothetical protein